MKNNKGITLIALVITIIVLLILAGVSIAMLTGDNGILTKATDASNDTEIAEVLERVNMELNAQLTNAMAGDKFDAVSTIEGNIGTLPTGYSVDVKILDTASSDTEVDTPSAYDTDYKVQITITSPTDVSLSVKVGTVSYASNKWSVTPVKK